MKIGKYKAFLDTCVLAPMPVADTLLRLAEGPAFYAPHWSGQVLDELRGTLRKRFKYSEAQVARRIRALESAFPDAMVCGYEDLIASMTNDAKDRHVLAAAVRCGAHGIVTDNGKHFPAEALAPYGLECLTADDFLVHQYHLNPDAFIGVLVEQAADIGWTLPQLLSRHVPSLSKVIVAH